MSAERRAIRELTDGPLHFELSSNPAQVQFSADGSNGDHKTSTEFTRHRQAARYTGCDSVFHPDDTARQVYSTILLCPCLPALEYSPSHRFPPDDGGTKNRGMLDAPSGAASSLETSTRSTIRERHDEAGSSMPSLTRYAEVSFREVEDYPLILGPNLETDEAPSYCSYRKRYGARG